MNLQRIWAFLCKYLWRHFTAKMTFYSLVTGLSGLSIISMKCWLRLKQLPAFTNKMPLDMFLTLVFHILALFTRCKNTSAFKLDIREFTQRRFWATHVNRKWAFLSFNMPYRRYQICMLSVFTLIEAICRKICSKHTNWWMLHEVSPQWVRLEFTKNILAHPCYIAVSVRNMTLVTRASHLL